MSQYYTGYKLVYLYFHCCQKYFISTFAMYKESEL
jgi:hypothetical protein